jgi:Transcription factor IIA, alpha/beta subunit
MTHTRMPPTAVHSDADDDDAAAGDEEEEEDDEAAEDAGADEDEDDEDDDDDDDHAADIAKLDDDLDAAEEADREEIPDVGFALYEKVHRSKNRWRCSLRFGVFFINGREYMFNKASTDLTF